MPLEEEVEAWQCSALCRWDLAWPSALGAGKPPPLRPPSLARLLGRWPREGEDVELPLAKPQLEARRALLKQSGAQSP